MWGETGVVTPKQGAKKEANQMKISAKTLGYPNAAGSWGKGICDLNRMSKGTSRLLPCRAEKYNERQSSCLLIKGKYVRSIPLDRQESWKWRQIWQLEWVT